MSIADRILSKQDRDGMLRRSLERIIQLYTDKSHFIYELLQNAEDASASQIRFVQYEDRLVVMHDGAAFTEKNLQGLCDIGQSDKINNLNQIGEFGVGFKSVFGICDVVRLYSNPRDKEIASGCEKFAIEIHDFTKPEAIDYKEVPSGFTTVFEFPYRVGETFSGFATVKALKEAIAARLKNLGITTLLFMRHLSVIDYEIYCRGLEHQGQYLLDKEKISPTCTKVSALENEDKKQDSLISFLLFSMPIRADMPNRTLDIAFQTTIDKEGRTTFQVAKSPYISVYFPTETESKLKFIVQGPFRTTPNRSSVPADDPTNIQFAKSIGDLLYKSILEIRDMGLLDLSFIKILPLFDDDFRTYGLFHSLVSKVKMAFKDEKVLPTNSGEYVFEYQALIARNRELTDVFSNRLISKLRKSNTGMAWLPVSITETGPYRDVYSFLVNTLGIEVVRPEDLRVFFNENPDFLAGQDNDWLIKLYRIYETVSNIFLPGNPRNILDACIVKTASGKFVAPYRKTDNGYLPNVFLPPRNETHYGVELVNSYLYDRCRGFFENVLHLKQPDEYELIKKSIAKRYKDIKGLRAQEHFEDIKRLIRFLKDPSRAEDLRNHLRNHFYIRCKRDGKTIWIHPFVEIPFFPESSTGIKIEAYFEYLPGYKKNTYIDYDFYQSAGFLWDDLRLFDVTDCILIGIDETWGDYKSSSGANAEWRTNGAFRWKLSIEQVEAALMYISTNPKEKSALIKSQTILRLLFENESRLVGTVNFTRSASADLYDEPAEIIHFLRHDKYNYLLKDWDGKWLFTKAMDLVSQDKITKRDLNESIYGRVSLDSNLYNLLGFKKSKDDQLAEVEKEYDQIPADKRRMYLEIELHRQFGLTIDQVKQLKNSAPKGNSGSFISYEDASFEFPVDNVKNWNALKKHAAQILMYANPVRYEKVLRSERVSRSDADIDAYLKNMYRDGTAYRYACQLCHRPYQMVTMCQLENKPDKELDPMNLCLCPNCARKFQAFRANAPDAKRLMDKIAALTEDDISREDYVSVSIKDMEFWFTQTHIAEIVELLRIRKKADEDEVFRSGKVQVAGAPQPIKKVESQKGTNIQDDRFSGKMVDATTNIGEKVHSQDEKQEEKNDVNYYKNSIGKIVYHTAMKKKAMIVSCDGTYIVLRFLEGPHKDEEKSYSLAVCMINKWLSFDH